MADAELSSTPRVATQGPRWNTDLIDLYQTHFGSLVRLARQHCSDEQTAEDSVQDAFVHFHERSGAPAETKWLSYLQTMVVNNARGAIRRTQSGKKAVERLTNSLSRDPNTLEEHLVSRDLVELIRLLPERQRETFGLRYLAGLSEKETAVELSVCCGTVKQHTARARSFLRENLEDAA